MQRQAPQERIQKCIVEKSDVPVPRVTEEVPEVEKLKSQLSGREGTLLADKKPASKLNGGCVAQAPEWEELQRLGAEGLVAVHDTIKLLNDYDSLELPKEILPSPSLMQLQSDKRGVARRARAVVRKSSGSPGEEMVSLFQRKQTDGDNKKAYCSTSVDRTKGEDKSLAIDMKSHESVSAAKHRSNRSTQQRNNCRIKQWQQPRKEEEGREEKGREEREKGRKGEGERGREESKEEEEKEAEEEGSEQVEKDVMDWTVVTRNKRQKKKKLIQIFVKVNGSKATPMEVSLKVDKVEDLMRQIQKDEDAYVTMQGQSADDERKAEELQGH